MPASVRLLVAKLRQENPMLRERVSQLEGRPSQLEERVNQNSQNSSRSPSTDGFARKRAKPSNPSGYKRSGHAVIRSDGPDFPSPTAAAPTPNPSKAGNGGSSRPRCAVVRLRCHALKRLQSHSLGTLSDIVISDRDSAYAGLPMPQRHVCWALQCDFVAMSKHSGASAEMGPALLRRHRRLFR